MNKKQKQFVSAVVGIAIAILAGYGYFYLTKPVKPITSENGEIKGNYSLADIMSLDKPYVCTFEKGDGISSVAGTIHIYGKSVYGNFGIQTKTAEDKVFQSFLLVKDKDAYSWTSLAPVGYKSSVAKSASVNASPAEQAQIVGTRDKIQYECKIWEFVDPSLFEIPTSINFTDK